MKISFITPVYNEETNIEKNIQKILSFAKNNFKDFEIIAVDDGSSDHSWKILEKLRSKNIIIDKNPHNMGPGAAFRRGFALAKGDVIVTLDSDLSYPIEDTSKLLKKLNEGYGGVVASPFLQGAGHTHVPFFRLLLSKLGTLIYTIFLGQYLSAYTCFFRAYRKGVIKNLKLEANGFESQVEIIWKTRRMGHRFAEVPSFQTFDVSRPSNFKILRELGRHLHFLLFKIIPGQVGYLLFRR
ncbi:MAG TPA: glycosyltransferase family 2 protein [Candidatus Bilamarchaeaceae archaeon]|nr:glycosyltransferase family 2 protein [Candidatus Bilamarchaeaceae archaeon]